MSGASILAGLAVALALASLGVAPPAPPLPDMVRWRTSRRPHARRPRHAGRPPAFLARATARPGGLLERLGGRWRGTESGARLEAAGYDGAHTSQLAAVRGASALAGLALAAILAPGLPARWALLTALAGPAAGFLAPDVWLRRRARERERAIA